VTVRLEHGDCLDVMRALIAEGVRVDAVITDPPYGLGFMGKHWDSPETVAFRAEVWELALQLLKPGGHMVAFSGTRTYHRMACAIEDAGFEIRDQLAWCYGSGFPKSHDISKAIDREAGAVREVVGQIDGTRLAVAPGQDNDRSATVLDITAPATEAAREWQGWGSALKPAWEPIALARKPLDGTLAGNTLKHGCGGLNIDGCRVGTEGGTANGTFPNEPSVSAYGNGLNGACEIVDIGKGRFPANLMHDGSPEVLAGFPDAPGQQRATGPEFERHAQVYGKFAGVTAHEPRNDSGSAARFFYTAKADAADRLGSKHPTVKPVDLMAWLCRLITPPGGLILDPFAGSGTTGMAAMREGFRAILIEREAEYVADIKRRLAHVRGEDAPLFAGGAA
jgi:site-specific DNA-methyltransferase (adenine-specific)